MPVDYQFVRALTGPQIISGSTEFARLPNLKFTDGFSVETDLSIPANVVSVDISYLATLTTFTSSMGGVTFYNALTPRFVLTGSISSGSVASITCSIPISTHFQCVARGVVRSESGVVYTKSLNTFVSYISGSNPTLHFQNAIDDAFSAVAMSLSASISGSSLVFALSSGVGSSYPFTLLADGSSFSVH